MKCKHCKKTIGKLYSSDRKTKWYKEGYCSNNCASVIREKKRIKEYEREFKKSHKKPYGLVSDETINLDAYKFPKSRIKHLNVFINAEQKHIKGKLKKEHDSISDVRKSVRAIIRARVSLAGLNAKRGTVINPYRG